MTDAQKQTPAEIPVPSAEVIATARAHFDAQKFPYGTVLGAPQFDPAHPNIWSFDIRTRMPGQGDVGSAGIIMIDEVDQSLIYATENAEIARNEAKLIEITRASLSMGIIGNSGVEFPEDDLRRSSM